MPKKRRRSPPWLVIIPAILVIAAAGWYFTRSGEQTGETEYQTASVTRGDMQTTISSAGKIQPRETVEVGAQVSGQLEELLVEAGDLVEEGQLLAQIDATIATTNVDAQRAELKRLKASRLQQQANLKLARSEAERAQALFEADAISRAELESAEASLTVAEGQLAAIDAQIEQQSSSLTADLAELEFTKIYAPVTGTVVALSASEGQTLNANQTAPTILTIADLTNMTVETDVSEADVLSVTSGQKAWFTTLGDPDRKWETEVRQILPTPEVVNDVVLYKALLDISNPDGLLRTEMTAQVFFITGEAEDALIVPVTALQGLPTRPGGATGAPPQDRGPMAEMRKAQEEHPGSTLNMVLVMGDDGQPRPHPVLVGLKTRTQAEIILGLSEGQTVITGQVKPSSISRPSGTRPPGGFSGRPPPR